jgi:hypothetical protein
VSEREDNKTARWYVLKDRRTGTRCLVEANNRAQAARRYGEYYCSAHPATVSETIELTREECDVISARETGPEQLDLEELTTGTVPEPRAAEGNGGSATGAPAAPAPLETPTGALSEPYLNGPTETGRAIRETTRRSAELRKASSVFGPGFGDRTEPDVG